MTLLLASKTNNGVHEIPLSSSESNLALILGGAHEGVMTHFRALESLDVL
jgi:hypothetical protein